MMKGVWRIFLENDPSRPVLDVTLFKMYGN